MLTDPQWLLRGEPRPAQIEALNRSLFGVIVKDTRDSLPLVRKLPHYGEPFARGWCHFMEPRTGKTPTTLNEFALLRRYNGARRLVVFAPNQFKETWATEAERFGLDVPVFVYDAAKRGQLQKTFVRSSSWMLAVNYQALHHDVSTTFLEELIDDKTVVVCDESVSIKSHQSLGFMNLMALAKPAMATRCLSGFPTPQAPYDLWAQLRFARQIEGFNFFAFKHRYTKLGGFKNKEVRGIRNAADLNKLLDRCSFRARRADWGTRIENDYDTRTLEMTADQKRAYATMEREFVAMVGDETVTAEQVITKHIKLQQISSGFVLNEDGEIVPITKDFKSTPKMRALYEMLTTEIPYKTLVMAHYRYSVECLLEALAPLSPALIAGNATMAKYGRDAQAEKGRFNQDPTCRLLVAQSTAVKYGHTLMGTKDDPCLAIVFFENSYNLDTRIQCEERPQGEGQMAAIQIVDFFSSPVEKRIVEALQRKQCVAEAVMGYYRS